MPFLLPYHTTSRITLHGLHAYPEDGVGLLLGEASDPATVLAFAALPVGKTASDPAGADPFAQLELAHRTATELFRPMLLHPIGFYCTLIRASSENITEALRRLPSCENAPWVLLRGILAQESLFGFQLYHWNGEEWQEAEEMMILHHTTLPTRNPKRINAAWNRTWRGDILWW